MPAQQWSACMRSCTFDAICNIASGIFKLKCAPLMRLDVSAHYLQVA